jgi:hypothetical protein
LATVPMNRGPVCFGVVGHSVMGSIDE